MRMDRVVLLQKRLEFCVAHVAENVLGEDAGGRAACCSDLSRSST